MGSAHQSFEKRLWSGDLSEISAQASVHPSAQASVRMLEAPSACHWEVPREQSSAALWEVPSACHWEVAREHSSAALWEVPSACHWDVA